MHKCSWCEKEFENGYQLGGHRSNCRYGKNFEDLEYRTCKKIILEERSHRCESCKRKTWLGNFIPLELNHIDGNRKNNKRENMELVCPNCHALTSTYRGANASLRRLAGLPVIKKY